MSGAPVLVDATGASPLDAAGIADTVDAVLNQLELLPAGGYTPRPLSEHRWRAWGGRTGAELIAACGTPGPSMPVQVCNGMGVDSAAIITELVENPDARLLLVPDDGGGQRLIRVDLADITIVTAMTGDEFDETRAAMEEYLLPTLRAAGIRTVQISRGGQSQDDGVVVLDDSRSPAGMVMHGPWRLRDELLAAGTVPQTASNARRCSARAKGWPLDEWAKRPDAYGDGHRVVVDRAHVIGFAAEESNRVAKDRSYAADCRRPVYPLRQWGWDRDWCIDYLYARFGIVWPRSCCTYCPFAGGSSAKNQRVAARWRREPAGGALAVGLELVALALNPRMALYKRVTARSVARQHGLTTVLDLVEHHLRTSQWAVYDVRRVHRPYGARKDNPGDPTRKGQTWRSVRTLRTGAREEMTAQLAGTHVGRLEPGVTPRLWLREAPATYPSPERFIVAAPAGVEDKEQDGFPALWAAAIAAHGPAGRLTEKEVDAA
ncbi:hypothetical protein [Micromonospora aurantiaca (nom. illeg.)]|uniref:hypothetical protein n=1 Tax=Micromonospora aurantiaca (nom. illeg.) TaxID=47850 RepID=UPI0033E75FDD